MPHNPIADTDINIFYAEQARAVPPWPLAIKAIALKINLGETAREFRETLGITQRAAAKALGITNVHLCNFEKGKSSPSQALLDRYQELWGIDLYVVSWCRHGNVERLPQGLRLAAAQLSKAWQKRLDALVAITVEKRADGRRVALHGGNH